MQCQRCILNWRKPIYLIFFWLFFFTLSFLSCHCINYFIHLDGHKVFIFLYSSLIFFWSCMMSHDILIYYFSVCVRKESHFNSSCHVMALCIIIFINMITCIAFMDNVHATKSTFPCRMIFGVLPVISTTVDGSATLTPPSTTKSRPW